MPPEAAEPDPKTEDATPGAAADTLTKEVVGSADSYRRLGEIFVSALAAIPTATLLTTLIRAPGDAGLHDWKLALGLALAAIALVLGVLLSVWLRTPTEIGRQALQEFDMSRIVGTSQPTYERLLARIEQLEDKLATATDAERPATDRHLRAVLATLRNVHLIAIADALRKRVLSTTTQGLAGSALITAAAAVFFLATAPKPKAAEATATGPSVVSVALTSDGAKKLGCSKAKFSALRLGGSDTEPQVVPLGRVTCTAGPYLTLKVAEKEGLASEVKVLEPFSPMPSGAARSTTTSTAPTATTP